MNILLRCVVALSLLMPGLVLAQTSYPRCSDDREVNVIWPEGGSGCREALPEEPPPGMGGRGASDPRPAPDPSQGLGPPIWRDFDPRGVPGWNGVLQFGLDLRYAPSFFGEGRGGSVDKPLTVLEVALRSEFGQRREFDVIRLRAEMGGRRPMLVVEHRHSSGEDWSAVTEFEAPIVAQAEIPIESAFYVPRTVGVRVEQHRAEILVYVNGALVLNTSATSKAAQVVRVRRGMFGNAAVGAYDVLLLDWFQPNFRLPSLESIEPVAASRE